MAVSFYDFSRLHHPDLLRQIQERLQGIFAENAFVEGKYNDLFEKELAAFVGAKHCKLVGNCTDGLEIGLLALGVRPGDLVGIPGISFHATAEAAVNIGASCVMIDVDPQTGLMDPESLERTAKEFPLKAIIPVHIYGLPAPMKALEDICTARGIKILEDAAQAIGTKLPHHPVGGGKNVAAFSFYPTKNLGAFGDAGAITCDDPEILQLISSIRNHGRSPQGISMIGRNSRCDHIQAAILQLKFGEFKVQNQRRKELAALYVKKMERLTSTGRLEIPGKSFIQESSWHLFPVLLQNRERKTGLADFLKKREIQTMFFYEKALGDERPLAHYPGERENSRAFAERVLCLPIHPFLTEKDITTVVESMEEFLK